MTSERLGIGIVWILAAVGAVLSLLLLPQEHRLEGVVLTMAGCVIVTFAVQLAAGKPAGYLIRAMLSIVGALVILAAADLVRVATGG